jgi:CubicO group peptidase (beta-lactamase class C family)
MNNFVIYSIEIAFGLALFYSVYWMFFKKETFFKLNRFYLVSSVVMSLLIPLLNINISPNIDEGSFMTNHLILPIEHYEQSIIGKIDNKNIPVKNSKIISEDNIKAEEITGRRSFTQATEFNSLEKSNTDKTTNWLTIGLAIYFIGSALFLLRFIANFVWIFRYALKHRPQQIFGMKVVKLKNNISPFSFLNLIFISDKEYPETELTKIIYHEKVHIKQKHSVDLILFELLMVFQWFNPFVWLYKRAIKITHEYLADDGTLNSGIDLSSYQYSLLSQALNKNNFEITNSYNFSIKERIKMMMKKRSSKLSTLKLVIALPVLIFLFSVFACNTGFSKKDAKLDIKQRNNLIDSIFLALNKEVDFSGNVLIAEDGKITYLNSFGFANEATKEKLNPLSFFNLGSGTKQFTAIAIMILKERKKLELYDEISTYFPELSFYKGITIRNLLNNTSGLPDYAMHYSYDPDPVKFDSLWDKTKIATNNDVISYLIKKRSKLLFEPGSKCKNSGTDYVLLASIIERVSHQTYPEFLKENIFKPAGMKNTRVYQRKLHPEEKPENYAYGYPYEHRMQRRVLLDSLTGYYYSMDFWSNGIYGDRGAHSNIYDLLKWDSILYTNNLVSHKTINAIYDSTKLSNKGISNYGYGSFINYDKLTGKFVINAGGWPGYSNYIERDIEKKKTFIILQNHNDQPPIQSLRRLVYGLTLEKKRQTISNTVLINYTGKYILGSGDTTIVTLSNGSDFKIQMPKMEPILLYGQSATKFFFANDEKTELEFIPDKNGKIFKMTLFRNGIQQAALKI